MARSLVSRCEICESDAEPGLVAKWKFPVVTRRCPRCGTFRYNSEVGWVGVKTKDHLVRLSGWTREQNDRGVDFPDVTLEVFRRVEEMRLPGHLERANRALTVIAKEWPSLTECYYLEKFRASLEVQGRSYSRDEAELSVLIKILVEKGCLRQYNENGTIGLSVGGLLAAEALGATRSASAQGFVAMSFHESLRDAWTNGFDPAIRAAGFMPIRIDAKEYVGGISDEIIAEIRRSSFVVVDYTRQNNGVYFEAGVAVGLGLTVIPTCRTDDVDNLHFDIKHLNTLLWKVPADLISGLSKRISAVIGTGPQFSSKQV